MAAQKKSSRNSSFFTRDLFIFISIMAIVAIMTYFLTYNAITARFTQQVGGFEDYNSKSIPRLSK